MGKRTTSPETEGEAREGEKEGEGVVVGGEVGVGQALLPLAHQDHALLLQALHGEDADLLPLHPLLEAEGEALRVQLRLPALAPGGQGGRNSAWRLARTPLCAAPPRAALPTGRPA